MGNISVPQVHRGIKSRRVDSRVVAFNVDYRDATRCARETSDGDVSRFTAPGGGTPASPTGSLRLYRLIYGAGKRSLDEGSGRRR